jgi:glycine hydroxymethyltransferase
MHVIAAKAVAFLEALKPSFKEYQQHVVKNAQAMAQQFIRRGYRVISGRTESHVFLVDLRAQKLTGKEADRLLGEAHITVNKNSIPNDPESPFVTSGIRIGTPAITTRGLKEKDAIEVVNFIADILDHPGNEEISLKVKAQVSEMMKKFSVYNR